MEIRIQNNCEELYWEAARMAVAECKMVAVGALRLCRSIFRTEEEKALENRYGHLFAPYGEGNVGGKILDRMVALSIPAYGNDLRAIEDMLDDPYHAELNAHYYFQTGEVLGEDYALPAFDWENYRATREKDVEQGIAMWMAHEEKKRAFFLSIAEMLWNFDWFADQYQGLVSAEEIEAYHEYCKKIFIEERVFFQPEWLLFSSEEWTGKQSFLQTASVDFFLQTHRDRFALLPACVLSNKTFKDLLWRKYKIKRF